MATPQDTKLVAMVGAEVDLSQAPKHSPEFMRVRAELEAREQHHEAKQEAARELETSLEPSDES